MEVRQTTAACQAMQGAKLETLLQQINSGKRQMTARSVCY